MLRPSLCAHAQSVSRMHPPNSLIVPSPYL
jgi:hypothetical protein